MHNIQASVWGNLVRWYPCSTGREEALAVRRQDPEVNVKVTYAADPENAHAVQDILREGLRRGPLKPVLESGRKDAPHVI